MNSTGSALAGVKGVSPALARLRECPLIFFLHFYIKLLFLCNSLLERVDDTAFSKQNGILGKF